MLLKMCLILGVTVYPKVQFVEIVPPRSSGKNHGWSVNVLPEKHEVSKGFFNVVIGECTGIAKHFPRLALPALSLLLKISFSKDTSDT